jgi:hypothetical protein
MRGKMIKQTRLVDKYVDHESKIENPTTSRFTLPLLVAREAVRVERHPPPPQMQCSMSPPALICENVCARRTNCKYMEKAVMLKRNKVQAYNL